MAWTAVNARQNLKRIAEAAYTNRNFQVLLGTGTAPSSTADDAAMCAWVGIELPFSNGYARGQFNIASNETGSWDSINSRWGLPQKTVAMSASGADLTYDIVAVLNGAPLEPRVSGAAFSSGDFTVATSTITKNAHGLTNGTLVTFKQVGSNSPPTGITYLAPYYVVQAATNTFKVSATVGGSPVAFTDQGGGSILVLNCSGTLVSVATETNPQTIIDGGTKLIAIDLGVKP